MSDKKEDTTKNTEQDSPKGNELEEWVDDGTRKEIPQPTESWFLGNIPDIDPVHPTASLRHLAHLYGPIFQVKLAKLVIFVSSQQIVHYISNEDKFQKVISAPLQEVRNFAGDGLFTAFAGEHNWTLAHRILIPAFGPLAIKKMKGMMLEIISQMLMSWEAHAGQPFEAADQYTRLTFDTIGYCAFRKRFNSFYTEKLHPFIDIMVKLLSESGMRARRPDLVKKMMFRNEAEYFENVKELHRQCDEIVAERRAHPDPEAKDLLNNMILDKDPKTGEQLSDDNIRFQMVTFLIAGHETTSGMLSFATYYMLKNPRTFQKARQEADAAIAEAGGDLLEINPAKLPYIDAITKETLRLQPSAPAFTVASTSEGGDVLPGGYQVDKGVPINVLLHELHRDTAAWGPDADEFRPERFLEKPIPKDAWKPFGNGQRACIGRGFAIQEALLALCLIVSRFDLEMADPSYDLAIKQTLTVKPEGFHIVARLRKDNHQSLLSELIAGGKATTADADHAAHEKSKKDQPAAASAPAGQAGKLYVLYGSNSGSCEGLANEVASEGSARGFAVSLGDLDSVAGGGQLPTDGPVVICTASYEGKPTDNARMFVNAIEDPEKKDLAKGVKYTVMGAGHHDWASTFHRIPVLIDKRLEELGGERIMPLHKADAGGDIVGDFEEFKTDLWDHFGVSSASSGSKPVEENKKDDGKDKDASNTIPVRVLPRSVNAAGGKIASGLDSIGKVVDQEVLVTVTNDRPQMNSIVVQLPKGQTYRAGDYLAVLPKNPTIAVERALKHFGINVDDTISLDIKGSTFLPTGVPVPAAALIGEYVELGQPASKRLLPKLAEMCTDGRDSEGLKSLEEDYVEQVTNKRVSLLDLLERFKSCQAPLDFFLTNLPKMKIRQYSISSTPLASPDAVSLTFTVHTVPDPKGGEPKPAGVASNYLAFLKPGDSVTCTVKASSEFHLPADPSVPVVLFAAGSGFAPFRGFIQERALQAEAGRKVGKTVLYYGTRTEEEMVHKDDLCKWVKAGVLDLRPVLSRQKETSLQTFSDAGKDITVPAESKYVQHRVWNERDSIRTLFEEGALFYTCGSGAKLGNDLKKTLVDIIKESKGYDDDKAREVYEKLAKDRYKTDVFL